MNIKNYKRFFGTSLFCSLISLSCGNQQENQSEDDKIVFVGKLKGCLQTDSVDDFVVAVEESLTKFSSRIADSEYKDKQWKLPIEYLTQEGDTVKESREAIVADSSILKKSFEDFLLQKFGATSDDDKSSTNGGSKEEKPEEPKSPNSDDDDDTKIPDGGSNIDDDKKPSPSSKKIDDPPAEQHEDEPEAVLDVEQPQPSLGLKLLRLHHNMKMNLKLLPKLKLFLL